MKMRIPATLALIFLTQCFSGQATKRDSLKMARDSLISGIEILKKSLDGCSDFELQEHPEWAGNIPGSKTYYRNCRWSGTYLIINPDSTFLYKYNGEGGANYLQIGKWQIETDSVLVLTGNDKLTNGFVRRMMKFDDRYYYPAKSVIRNYLRKGNILLPLPALSPTGVNE
jgi:hypothetical protein